MNLYIFNRNQMLEEVYASIEHTFTLIGSTAIEDRLQSGVHDTIHFMREAGLKVWMLTGDKIETAVTIGHSSGLLDEKGMRHHMITQGSYEQVERELAGAEREIVEGKGQWVKISMLISGEALGVIQGHANLREMLMNLVDHLLKNEEYIAWQRLKICRLDVVLACRVSPKQKADLVKMVSEKHPTKTTLAINLILTNLIGDGANDVNMITTAHVGVGVLGLEGSQAARSSDYAIAQFRFLKPLLFIHGREAYRRNAYLVNYNFYKNAIFVLPQYWYGFFYCGFSGQTLYEAVMYQMYNILFASMPIIWYSIFDFQYEKERYLEDPSLYEIGIKHMLFGTRNFCRWFSHGAIQALILVVICYTTQQWTTLSDGKTFDFWMNGQVLFICVVLIVNFKILCDTHNFHVVGELFVLSMIFNFFGLFYLENLSISIVALFGTFGIVMTTFAQTYLCVFLCVSMIFTVDPALRYLQKAWKHRSRPKRVQHEYQSLVEHN